MPRDRGRYPVPHAATAVRVCARHPKNDSHRCPVCRAHQSVKAAELANLCIQCDTPMRPSSGGKRLCDRCGYIVSCCDTV